MKRTRTADDDDGIIDLSEPLEDQPTQQQILANDSTFTPLASLKKENKEIITFQTTTSSKIPPQQPREIKQPKKQHTQVTDFDILVQQPKPKIQKQQVEKKPQPLQQEKHPQEEEIIDLCSQKPPPSPEKRKEEEIIQFDQLCEPNSEDCSVFEAIVASTSSNNSQPRLKLSTAWLNERFKQPKFLKTQLYDHQKIGILWAIQREQHDCGGILADEMGLGKTVQILALILHSIEKQQQNEQQQQNGDDDDGKKIGEPTLIIVPSTAISHWMGEIKTHLNEEGLKKIKYCSYHGATREKDVDVLQNTNIVITSFATVAFEFTKDEKNKYVSDKKSPLFLVKWNRIVVDEAHNIRNPVTVSNVAINRLHSRKRFAVTGTPISNSLWDLFTLLTFVSSDVTEDDLTVGSFKKIVDGIHDHREMERIELQHILDRYLLRRTKKTLDSQGKPIVVLPNIQIQNVYVQLSENELDFYEQVFSTAAFQIEGYSKKLNGLKRNINHIFQLMIRLRQTADHPYITIRSVQFEEDKLENRWNFVELAKAYQGFVNDKNASNRDFLSFSQTLLAKEPDKLTGTPPSAPFPFESNLNSSDGDNGLCCQCLNQLGKDDIHVSTCCDCRFCCECASNILSLSSPCPICNKPILSMTEIQLSTTPSLIPDEKLDIKEKKEEKKESTTTLSPSITKGKFTISGAKIDKICEIIHKHLIDDPGLKCVLFSQFTSFLDLIESRLSEEKIKTIRMDGKDTLEQRSAIIKQFTTSSSPLTFLISVKVGGTALNLTSGNVLILADPWWNPQIDRQAIERVHRIGQARNVIAYRIFAAGTIEDRMHDVQDIKSHIANFALNEEHLHSQEESTSSAGKRDQTKGISFLDKIRNIFIQRAKNAKTNK